MSRVMYKGPTVLVVKDTEGNVFGAHASTSWCDTQGGWVGNGERLEREDMKKIMTIDCRRVFPVLHPAQDGRLPLLGQGRELPDDDRGASGHGRQPRFIIRIFESKVMYSFSCQVTLALFSTAT